MYSLLCMWLIINVVAVYVVTIASAAEAEREPSNIFFFPLLVESLREILNKTGTVIAIIFISLFLAPAIITYYLVGSVVLLAYAFCKRFVKLFKRKD